MRNPRERSPSVRRHLRRERPATPTLRRAPCPPICRSRASSPASGRRATPMCREPGGRNGHHRPSPTIIGFALVESAGMPPPDWATKPASMAPRRPVASSSRPEVPDIDQAMSVRPSELKSASSGSARVLQHGLRDERRAARREHLQPVRPVRRAATASAASVNLHAQQQVSAAVAVEVRGPLRRAEALRCGDERLRCDARSLRRGPEHGFRRETRCSSGRQVPAPRDRSTGIPDEDEVVQPVAIDIDESRAARGRDVRDSRGRVRIRRARSLAQPLPGVPASGHHDVTAPVAVEVSRQRLGRRAVRSEPRVEW